MRKYYTPLLLVFIIFNALLIVFKGKLASYNINYEVVIIGNIVIALLSIISLSMHAAALKRNNANAFVRSVTAGSFMKLMVIGISAMAYLFIIKKRYAAAMDTAIYSVVACLILYVVYTVIEVKTAMRMNQRGA